MIPFVSDRETATPAAVPMSGASITELEIASVVAALSSGCLSIGPHLEEFEGRIARMSGSKHAVGVSSGTAGLHLAVVASGVEPGDLVITTPFSFVASANCVLYERGIPVFVDVDPLTGNIDTDQVAQAVRDLCAGGSAARRWLPPSLRSTGSASSKVRAILPVHAFGQPADLDPIVNLARSHSLAVIEDSCEAVGAVYKHRHAGTIGDVGVYAFYPNKQMTTGEGGMIVTDRDDWASLFRSLRNQGRDHMDSWLRHDRLGYNYRLNELSAALGTAQLSRLGELLAARDRVAGWYFDRLNGIPGLKVPSVVTSTTRMSWFAYVARLEPNIDREKVMRDLAARGIPSRTYFSPIHLQPFFASRFGYSKGDFPVTEALGESSLALPFSATLSEDQVNLVCRALAELLTRGATV